MSLSSDNFSIKNILNENEEFINKINRISINNISMSKLNQEILN